MAKADFGVVVRDDPKGVRSASVLFFSFWLLSALKLLFMWNKFLCVTSGSGFLTCSFFLRKGCDEVVVLFFCSNPTAGWCSRSSSLTCLSFSPAHLPHILMRSLIPIITWVLSGDSRSGRPRQFSSSSYVAASSATGLPRLSGAQIQPLSSHQASDLSTLGQEERCGQSGWLDRIWEGTLLSLDRSKESPRDLRDTTGLESQSRKKVEEHFTWV